ncbi:hypothetical protein SKAU_G00152130 [Synaphobranchus kaupii]|uniref:E3 ubiquitin-protein ligase n=1 Tax=Synaphobranchus kaupii TaxID=118154 RepID=A0A9Q1FGT8_SYNKA|nr:hypothetical protein SKAU_G00152130 [Synaphobranchus kaupii]
MSGDSEVTPMEVDGPPASYMHADSSSGIGSAAKENALAASGTRPMTNENPLSSGAGHMANQNPLYSGTGPTANQNTLYSGTGSIAYEGAFYSGTGSVGNEGAFTASAESQVDQQDLYTAQDYGGCIQVEVDWPKEITENKKRKVELQKAIQTLLNNDATKAECDVEDLKNERFAVVWVTPPSAMDVLFQEKELMFKSCNKTARVRFSPAPSQNTERMQRYTEVYPGGVAQSVHSEKTTHTSLGKSSVASPLKKEELHPLVDRPVHNHPHIKPAMKNANSLHTATQAYPGGVAQSVHSEKTTHTSLGKSSVASPLKKEELQPLVDRPVHNHPNIKPAMKNENSLHTATQAYLGGVAQSVHSEKTTHTSLGKSSLASPLKKEELNRKVYQLEEEQTSRHDSMDLNAGNKSTAFNQGEAQVEKETLTVPLFQYWHITTACSKEVDQIRRNNRVDIEGQALVSIKAQVCKESQGSAAIAQDEFTNLFQKFAQEIHSITVPVTSLDQSHMMGMLKEIQREEHKLVMSVSSKGCQISGPKESLDRFQRNWKLESRPQDSEGALQKTLDMNLRDPLEKQGLTMDSLHWEFIRTVFNKQVMAIKQKFGVDFSDERAAGMVIVKAVLAGDQKFPLACHALKALEQLYQKGATDILACPLENPIPGKDELIKNTFEAIRPRYPYIAPWHANGPWRLVGLAEHLRAAVKEMESMLGEPVFSEKAKQQLQCPEPSPATSEGATGSQAGVTEEEQCPICLEPVKDMKKLKCTHKFCSGCIKEAVEHVGPCCPVCREVFGEMEGNQPAGQMKFWYRSFALPGFPDCGTIEIDYNIPGGTQTKKHPNPGKPFSGAHRQAYLPDNQEGKEVLRLLQRAFNQKLIFTVGTSNTSGATDTVTWNDIHHKTSTHGGPYGYPDPDYLKRVKEELKAKGIE